MAGHVDAVYDFALDRANKSIYSVGADGYVVQWDPLSGGDGELILRAPEAFYSVVHDAENHTLYAGSMNGVIYTIDLLNRKLQSNLKVHEGGVFALKMVNGVLWSGGADGVLNMGEDKLHLSKESIRCMEVQGNMVAVGCSDHRIYLVDTTTGKVNGTLEGHDQSVFGLEFVYPQVLASTGRDARILLWDVMTYQVIKEVPAHMYQAKSLSFNGHHLLSCSMDKTIKIWSPELDLLKVMDKQRNEAHTNCVNRVEWLDDKMFVSCSDDRTLMVWEVEINP